tara:strand:- start:44 stop:619 length:576 start_codon:yes stop_codon:yes gene_type:complete
MNKFFRIILFFIFVFIIACQKVETFEKEIFNFNLLPSIMFNAENKNINSLYEENIEEPFYDHSLNKKPIEYLKELLVNNFNTVGTSNYVEINIIDASVKKYEIPNTESSKFQEKTILMFEANFMLEFLLYDDSNFLLSNIVVESERTITSGKLISLIESDIIIEKLIYDSLKDLTKKSEELLKIHMSEYLL